MEKLRRLFNYIKSYNNLASIELINDDNNNYYFCINGKYLTEIDKKYLISLNEVQLIFEAKYILNNY